MKKRFALMLLALVCLMGANCPTNEEVAGVAANQYRLRFINSDRTSGGLDVIATATTNSVQPSVAIGREYGDSTGLTDSKSLGIDYKTIKIYKHGTVDLVATYTLTNTPDIKPGDSFEFVFLGAASNPPFLFSVAPGVPPGMDSPPNYTFKVVNTDTAGAIDVYNEGLAAPKKGTVPSLSRGYFGSSHQKTVSITRAGTTTILAESIITSGQSLVFQPDKATGGAPFSITSHRYY